jgi:hypothetical protein
MKYVQLEKEMILFIKFKMKMIVYWLVSSLKKFDRI